MSEPKARPQTPGEVDVPTLIAIAICAYAITNVAHEGGGHGGMCVLVGGKPVALSAIYFDCNEDLLGIAGQRWVSAGGTMVNLVIGALAWAALRFTGKRVTPGRYFVWLLMTLSFLQATGYWMFSGIGGFGDWANVIDGLSPQWPWRAGLAVTGAAGYYLAVRLALRTLSPMLGCSDGRVARARKLMLVPYLAGGVLYVAAGLLNPVSAALVLVSAAAASFGGASALCWSFSLLHDQAKYPGVADPPLSIPRSVPWLVAAAGVAAVFIGVLGRTVRF